MKANTVANFNTKKPRGKKPLSLRDIAYQRIKKQIITCKLKPDEVLSEAVLSQTLNIGRTPVHQAIGLLEADGLLQVVPRKGVIVKPLSLDDAMEIVEVRLLTEGYCASVAAKKIDDAGEARLRDNLTRMRQAIGDKQAEKILQIDGEFHREIAALGGNSILHEFLANLHDRAVRFWFVSLQQRDQQEIVLAQHEAIVAAITAAEPEQAQAAMRAHIEQFIANLARQF